MQREGLRPPSSRPGFRSPRWSFVKMQASGLLGDDDITVSHTGAGLPGGLRADRSPLANNYCIDWTLMQEHCFVLPVLLVISLVTPLPHLAGCGHYRNDL